MAVPVACVPYRYVRDTWVTVLTTGSGRHGAPQHMLHHAAE